MSLHVSLLAQRWEVYVVAVGATMLHCTIFLFTLIGPQPDPLPRSPRHEECRQIGQSPLPPTNERQGPAADRRRLQAGVRHLFALAALVLLSPLLLCSRCYRLSDGGSVFYGHRRIGRNGKIFECLKFRTMVRNGEHVLAAHFAVNPQPREEWNATRKLQNDPRVTPVGAVLRKLSLDELPQIFNILRGDMSIVGPRPVVEDELELYGPAADYYLKSRPGLTGLWQVSGRNDVSYGTRVAFDRHYVENWSLSSTLKILMRPFRPCVSRAEAIDLDRARY